MSDIVQRLRDGLEAGAVDLADIMDAADEIARLRLTAAEREAITWAARQPFAWVNQRNDTLRSMLERTAEPAAAAAVRKTGIGF